MKTIRFLLRRMKTISLARMYKFAKHISEVSNKNTIFILLDMFYCGLRYQLGYYEYQEFEFYLLNRKQRKTFLTAGLNNKVVLALNDQKENYKLENKIEFNKLFHEFLKREWLELKADNFEDFNAFFAKHQEVVCKDPLGTGGKGISVVNYENKEKAFLIFKQCLENKQTLIEERVKQDDNLNELNPDSVNTLRITTILKDNIVHVVATVVKIGNGKKIDNFTSGGIYSFVDENGMIMVEAIDREDHIYDYHPITNTKIKGFKIKQYDDAVRLVSKAAMVVPKLAYVGWDVAFSVNGPCIIEGNEYPGIYQIKPSLMQENKQGLVPRYQEILNIF